MRGYRMWLLDAPEKITNSLKAKIAEKSKRHYKDSAEGYREGDDKGYEHYSLAYFREMLRSITSAFSRKLTVLDLGCGTGRYFHCLKNTEKIVGIDVSEHMLEFAKNPSKKYEIEASEIELICSDVHSVVLAEESFDFIYSIGLFGLHSPFDTDCCNKIFHWLKPGGKACLYIMDASTPREPNWKREVAVKFLPILPKNIQIRLFLRINNFSLTAQDIQFIMDNSLFNDFHIIRSRDLDPEHRIWNRMWFLCIASRPERSMILN